MAMDAKELSTLPEDSVEESPSIPPHSAFSSIPDHSPIRTSLQKYAPLEWIGYFDEEEDITIPGKSDVFHIYRAGSSGPVVFCLHGGGYSGLSFALSGSKIKEKARVVAMDLRGHGKSCTNNDLDLSIENLCFDVVDVVKVMYGDSSPAIVLVGHRYNASYEYNEATWSYGSAGMGGSIAVHLAAKEMISNLAGLVVVDVVEGTAMASLIHMQKILSNRPHHFHSIEKAIEWSVKGGSLRNIESARVSVPSTLTYDETKKCFTYRTPLEESERYWKGWYEGLSDKFLSSPVPKLLLLAGTDRLDRGLNPVFHRFGPNKRKFLGFCERITSNSRTLTIGQMQGKFQMIVVRHTGHAIQEDTPDEFASLILNFISRNHLGPYGVEIPGLRQTVLLY